MSIDNLFLEIKRNKKNNKIKDLLNRENNENLDIEDNVQYCKECKSNNLLEKYGNYICSDCGLFNGKVIDFKQEWRYYGSEDNKNVDPSRCGIPTNELLPQSSIGSVIGFGSNESHMMRRIRNMQYWNTIPYRESSLLESFNNISIICQNAGLSSCIIEEAKYMYKQVSEVKTSRRTKKEAMKGASVYWACQLKGVPRSCKEIAKIFNIKDVKIMNKAIKKFDEIWNSLKNKNINKKEFDTEVDLNKNLEFNEDEQKYESLQYLHRYCCNLKVNDYIYNLSKKIVIFIEKKKILETHNPLSRIAAALYYIIEHTKLDIKKQNIIDICDVSEVTINKCYLKLLKFSTEISNILDIDQ